MQISSSCYKEMAAESRAAPRIECDGTQHRALPGSSVGALRWAIAGLALLALWWSSGHQAWAAPVMSLAPPPADRSGIPGDDKQLPLATVGSVTRSLPAAPPALPALLPSSTAVLTSTSQMGPGIVATPIGPDFVRVRTGRILRAPLRGDGILIWPVRGTISQSYSDEHKAIDIAEPDTDAVVASDAGVVAYAAWNSAGYGYLVVVNHGNGMVTYYAHLFGFYVDVGQAVKRGQPLGMLGSTGRSTGPHLHFEVRDQGVLVDPLSLLPPG